MKIIKAKNENILVDDEYFQILSQFKWNISKERGYKYAVSGKTRMHRVIMGTSHTPNIQVDHIDGNGLNNQESNLRQCTQQQNLMNQKTRSTNTSGYKGVSYNKERKKYQSYINANKIRKNLGWFNTKEEGAEAYNKAAKELHGDFARLNVIIKPCQTI